MSWIVLQVTHSLCANEIVLIFVNEYEYLISIPSFQLSCAALQISNVIAIADQVDAIVRKRQIYVKKAFSSGYSSLYWNFEGALFA